MNNFKDIEIRIARFDEATEISQLIYEAFADLKHCYTEDAFAETAIGVSEIEERIKSKTVWVAVCENKIVGTASGLQTGKGLYIRSVAVNNKLRGKGIGKSLINYLESLAMKSDFKNLELTTCSFLVPARRLYESLGFVYDGTEDLHGTELLRMKKTLNPFSSKIKFQKHDHIE